ncbi:hypothetical protein PM082_020194 [Marasmius tenuissimus]|nr:hypothetical protein PM082_020194 [Marasmius tenuissimus]
MDLTLVNNDPTKTLLVSSDGIPAYAVGTISTDAALTAAPVKTTTVTRLERSNNSSGRTQLEVGKIQHQAQAQAVDDGSVRMSLHYGERRPEFTLEIVQKMTGGLVSDNEQGSWSFTGPDERPYKWQVFIKYPVLFLNDTSNTPLARYRRAKLGIVSRSRRPFLEIFPAAMDCVDLVVVTFVTFMIHQFPALGFSEPEQNASMS